MKIDLPDDLVNRIRSHADPAHGLTAAQVLSRALDRLEATLPSRAADPLEGEAILKRLRSYRGMFGGMTLEDLLASRRHGLP